MEVSGQLEHEEFLSNQRCSDFYVDPIASDHFGLRGPAIDRRFIDSEVTRIEN